MVNIPREYLKKYREKSGLTQYELADKLYMAQSNYSKIEIGKATELSILTAARFADTLGVPRLEFYKAEQNYLEEILCISPISKEGQ